MKVGSTVLLVNDNWDKTNWRYQILSLPVLGEIYTVRKVISGNGTNGILLNEIINVPLACVDGGKCEISWYKWRFIEIFSDEAIICEKETDAILV